MEKILGVKRWCRNIGNGPCGQMRVFLYAGDPILDDIRDHADRTGRRLFRLCRAARELQWCVRHEFEFQEKKRLASVTAGLRSVKVRSKESPRRALLSSSVCYSVRVEKNLCGLRFDHLQIAAPPNCEQAAREFYGEILGMAEIEKPESLRARGGCWFQCGKHQLHVGVEQDFRPAKKAHLAFAVEDLDALRSKLMRRNFPVVDDDKLPGARRFYSADPWGNRLEFIQQRD